MSAGRLALLIPAYNSEEFLPRLLESASKQTVPFDEIWVYDDCSTDKTSDIASKYGVNVVRGEVNKGCSVGKNELAKRTSCEWLHFHDADDELKPRFVEKCHQWIKEGLFDVVIFSYDEYEDESGNFIVNTTHDANLLQEDAIAYNINNQINPFCGLYRKEAFDRAHGWDVDPNVLYNEDVAFHIRLAISGASFSADPESLVINHRRIGSMSAKNGHACVVAQWNVMKKAEKACHPRYDLNISRRLWEIAGVAASYKDWKTADSAAHLAARLAPPPAGLFRLMCIVSPFFALRVREYLIRFLKPSLRSNRV